MNLLLLQIILTIWTGMALAHLIIGLITLIMVLTNSTLETAKKLCWTVAVIFVPFLGSILYIIVGRIQAKRLASS